MENFTWSQVVLSLLGSGGGLLILFKLTGWVSSVLQRRRQLREADAARLVREAVDLEKVRIEAEHINEEAVKKAIWDLLREKKEEVERLEAKVQELENRHSMSHTTVRNIYDKVRAARRQLDILDTMVMRQTEHSELSRALEQLRQRLDELEKALP